MQKAITAALVLSAIASGLAGCSQSSPSSGSQGSGGSGPKGSTSAIGGGSATGGNNGVSSSNGGSNGSTTTTIAGGNTANAVGTPTGGTSSATTATSGAGGETETSNPKGTGGTGIGTGVGGSGTVSSGGSGAAAKNGGGAGRSNGSGGTAGRSSGTAGAKATGGNGALGGTSGVAGSPICVVPSGMPKEKVITFTNNGAWCWYQDERVLVDAKANKMILGSVASGGASDGNIQATIYDIAADSGSTSMLGDLDVDDHNAPAFVIRPDGKYFAMWSTHRQNCNTYFSIFDGKSWGTVATYDWSKKDGCPWGTDPNTTNKVTYSNPWYMSSESRLYSGIRSVETSPNFLVSTDDGASWKYYGRLTATPANGYVRGYYKYWGNGKDRIDFLGTEAHPRDFDNSLWHGYLQNEKIYNSIGTSVDDKANDGNAVSVDKFTPVFKTGTTLGGQKLNHAWNYDIMRYDDGTIAILGQARVAGSDSKKPDIRMFYGRFDGTEWKLTYLVNAGTKLYDTEEDYTGLGVLHPDNPNVIYVSTVYDPRNDKTQSTKHELWQGTTCNNGATFQWTPVTQNSTVDNIRPVVPKWDAHHTALLWLKGTYYAAQKWEMDVVGIIQEN